MNSLEQTTRKLTTLSLGAHPDSQRRLEWPARADTDRLAMSEALSPIAGLEISLQMSREGRWRLAMLEAASFLSLNIAAKRGFMGGLAQRIYDGRPSFVSDYLRHVLDEEVAHTEAFARFCLDYGGGILPRIPICLAHDMGPEEEELLFFARALVFDEVTHFYNKCIAGDSAVWSLSRDINRHHFDDKCRHIAFGRVMVEELWGRLAARRSPEGRRRIGRYLADHIATVLRSHVNPDVYSAVGLSPEVVGKILEAPNRRLLAVQSSEPVTRWLARIGITNGA